MRYSCIKLAVAHIANSPYETENRPGEIDGDAGGQQINKDQANRDDGETALQNDALTLPQFGFVEFDKNCLGNAIALRLKCSEFGGCVRFGICDRTICKKDNIGISLCLEFHSHLFEFVVMR